MEYVYGCMLLHSSGQDVSEVNLKKVLSAAGIDVDDARVKAIIASLEDVNIDEVIKLAPTTVAPAPVTAEVEKVEKVEEKVEKEEEEEEEEVEGLGALFG